MRHTKQNGRKRFRKKSTRRLRKKRAIKGGGGCDSVDTPKINYFRSSEEKICHGTFDETLDTFIKNIDKWIDSCAKEGDCDGNEFFKLFILFKSKVEKTTDHTPYKEKYKYIKDQLYSYYVYSTPNEENKQKIKDLIVLLEQKTTEDSNADFEKIFGDTIFSIKTEKEQYENEQKLEKEQKQQKQKQTECEMCRTKNPLAHYKCNKLC